jgi:hypothetical protein
MRHHNSRDEPRLSLIEWASRMAELNAGFAELMHDTADHMSQIDPELAKRFYLAADLTRIEVAHLRQIIPRQSIANCVLFGLGMIAGSVLQWLVILL